MTQTAISRRTWQQRMDQIAGLVKGDPDLEMPGPTAETVERFRAFLTALDEARFDASRLAIFPSHGGFNSRVTDPGPWIVSIDLDTEISERAEWYVSAVELLGSDSEHYHTVSDEEALGLFLDLATRRLAPKENQ